MTRAYFSAATLVNCFFACPNKVKLANRTKLILNRDYPYSNCTAIVPVNSSYSLGSSVGSVKLTNYIREITPFSSNITSIIVGIVLTPFPRLKLKEGMVDYKKERLMRD